MPSDCTQRTVDSTLDRFRAGRNTLEALMSTASWRTRPAAMSRHRPRPVRRSVVLSVLVASAILVPQGGGSIVSADPAGNPVTAWNEIAGEAALVCLAPTNNPLHESRMYAMLHAAIHDAVNAIDRRSQPYAFDGSTSADASVDAAVAKAAHDVLVPTLLAIPAPFPAECGQAAAAIVDAEYTATIDALPGGAAKTAGLAVGEQAAAAILALRANDGSDTPLIVTDVPQGTQPGEYRFTPGTPFQFAPGWEDVDPFVLRASSQYRSSAPYNVTSKNYAQDYDEVKSVGGDGITTPSARTPEQTQIALFWVESSPLQWNRIARTVATSTGLDTWESARLFGLLNLAMADGYISSFESKNHHNFWRPVTAIHEGDDDGNPATAGDATWTPLVGTPPIPDHDSAHAVEGAAAARVMQRFFGTDAIAFRTCSLTLPAAEACDGTSQVLRAFSSFSDAAAENGESRVLVGFHFRNAVNDGLRHGWHIANRTYNQALRPVR